VSELSVAEAIAAYEPSMRNVPGLRPGLCAVCRTFIAPAYRNCIPCDRQVQMLDAVVPITYSEHGGQVHHALWSYKNGTPSVQRFAAPRLAAVLWRFLELHEACVARASRVEAFELVTNVPSSTPERDEARGNLRWLVEVAGPVSGRFDRVLEPTGDVPSGREYDERRYVATESLEGARVLLIDDTWTTGGHAQSAAHALREAGAAAVGLVVIGRHVQPNWEVEGVTAGELLAALPRRFDWSTCAVH
jgi:hypothetical protein